ncbi:MAG TPA: D-alanine--D-alanine ligase family protein [Terriglobia bacterium]|nr:D-alanine--D-alanine ligase family protein [Terriglobia bacterium]
MSELKKTRVGVIFGGRSGEHEVSLRSAESVIRSLDPSKYEVVPIAITHEGRWLGTRDAMKLLSPGEAIQAALKTGEPMAVVPEPQRNGAVDVFFPIVHGTYGEDGTIQGLLELAGVPYVGAGVLGSAVGMDKDVMKRLLREAGLPVGDFWVTRSRDIEAFIGEFGKELPYPVFVKPANLGSSVGITKAHNVGELPAAIAFAAEFDRKIIIEKGIDAREIEISVLGNDELKASIPGEIIPSREFYDYQAKYVDDDSRLIIPAPLSEQQVRQAQDLAIRSFQALDCSGMARVDLFLEKPTGKFLVNEINTLPGFTSISMYPKLWEATGMAYADLVDRLITLAVERHAEKKKLRTKV